MKLYHEEDIRYGDTVQFTFKILDMSENTNDNAFNEKLYLYSQKIFYKGKLKQLSVKIQHILCTNGLKIIYRLKKMCLIIKDYFYWEKERKIFKMNINSFLNCH